ncbi:MAG TPA: DegT/DnrJ/EryC1/StrS family aminotransferase [Nitrososphaerales archaeon]|nr:DegT/DnrJ/EryC1/StrS family aminotransferase [Nitrososphaerales archaeon]
MTAPQSLTNNPVKLAKPFNSESIEKAVVSILRSGMLVQGQFVKEFESQLSSYIGCKHVIAVNSGTAALQVGISAVRKFRDIPPNVIPEVVTTPLSFAATANAAIGSGCLPVFADVDPETFNIDPVKVKEKITASTIAIEPVDVYGLPADLDGLRNQTGKMKIPIVEDSAEAIGALYKGKKIGNVSVISCFSTYATKNLHTCEGGFVTTNDDGLANEMRMVRNQGQASRYNQVTLGFNFRMQEMDAAIGLEQLKILDELNETRMNHALAVKEGLESLDCLNFQKVESPKDHSWYLFSLTLDERRARISRDKLVQRLKEGGVEADVAWPTPIHLQPYFRKEFGFKEGDFPISEKICKTVFQLPIQPFLTKEEVQRVVSTVKSILR